MVEALSFTRCRNGFGRCCCCFFLSLPFSICMHVGEEQWTVIVVHHNFGRAFGQQMTRRKWWNCPFNTLSPTTYHSGLIRTTHARTDWKSIMQQFVSTFRHSRIDFVSILTRRPVILDRCNSMVATSQFVFSHSLCRRPQWLLLSLIIA